MHHQQQINLFKKEFEYQPNLFPGKTFVNSVIVLFVAIFILMGWSYSRLFYYKTEIVKINRFQQEATKRISQVRSSYSNKKVDKNLLAELHRLENILYSKNIIQDKIRTFLNNNFAFSPVLTALSRQHMRGIRLTNIRLTENNAYFHLKGISIDPNLVTAYVEGLQKERSFQGLKFDDFILGSTRENNRELFVFRVGNTNLNAKQ